MSLLLEALKKAELAKQAAKEPQPTSGDPPLTRDQLPDISQPMEIRSEDLRLADPEPAPKRPVKLELELAPEEPPKREPVLQPAARAAAAETSYTPPEETTYSPSSEAAERKQAQQMFDAKELDVNPRKPFYITLGVLGLCAAGAVGYIWWEMQPKNVYKLPPPSEKTAPPPTAAAPAAPAPAAPAAAAETPAVSTVAPPVATLQAEPTTAPAPQRPAPAAAPVPVQQAAPAAPAMRSATAPRPAAPPVAAGEPAPRRQAQRDSEITITTARAQPDPVLEGAYQAFNAGDLAKAQEGYQQVLRKDRDNRDALLGMAAVETHRKRYDAAEEYYGRVLALDPRDAAAQAGLMGLRGPGDAQATESRLKTMIAAQPDAGFLHFALGNQYAAQSRWAEAQQAYFRAYTGDPENADFACNLAISLDRLHQSKPALEYYRRALDLARNRTASFDKAQIAKRVAQLER